MNESLLSVSHLNVSVGQKSLLNDVALSLKAGKVLAVLGENGAGKSTLLKSIIDADKHQTRGDCFFDGQAIAKIPLALRAQKIALLPQVTQLQFPFTVEEVIRLGRTPHSTSKTATASIIETQLKRLDILHLKKESYPNLSGGEKQRVNLARVLAQLACAPEQDSHLPPRLLLLDEPCAALDVQHQQQLLDIVRSLSKENIATVIVAHNINWVAQCADYFLALKKGEVIAQGGVHTVLRPEILQKIYGVAATVIEHPTNQRPLVVFNM